MKMRENKLVGGSVPQSVSRLLGAALEPVSEATSVIHTADDFLFIWNAKDASIIVVNTCSVGQNQIQTLNLADCPQHQVSGLLSSETGRWLAVYGPDGVTAVEVSRRSGSEGRLGGGDPDLWCRSVQVYRSRDGKKVQKAAWHPGSRGEHHLVLLTTDGTLSLQLVGEHSSRTARQVSIGGGRLSTALGETAVDFCFGPAVDDGGSSVWPLFVLSADGEVFYVLAHLYDVWCVEGPVEVLPATEKNFNQEACSILVVGGRTGPSILVVATVGGALLHHVMLGQPASGQLSLHLYQRVELDLGPLNSVFAQDYQPICPVRLLADPSSRSRYLVLHDSGLHQVEVPINVCEELLDKDLQCVVEHLVCTRPTVDSPAAPPLGATVCYPLGVIVCLCADHTLLTIKSRPSSLTARPVVSDTNTFPHTSTGLDAAVERTKDDIEARIRLIFSRDSTQPLIASASDAFVSQTQCLELLSNATETLHTEYVSRIVKARDELAAEVKLLMSKKQGQEALLNKLQASRTDLRARAELISERYEDIRDRGASLTARVEAVLTKAQSRAPAASDAQLKMARDLKMVRNKMEQIKLSTDQLKEKEKYQRYQGETMAGQVRPCCLSEAQVDNIKQVLQGNSQTIENLVKTINSAKKDISL